MSHRVRRQRLAELNSQPGRREALEAQHGQVLTTEELSQDFEAIGFMAPFVVVRRKCDGQKGRTAMDVVGGKVWEAGKSSQV